MRKFKVWRGLTTFGRGVVIALFGVLITSAGSLMKEDVFALVLTTIGIIAFIVGLYIALPAMDSQLKEFEDVQFGGEKKK